MHKLKIIQNFMGTSTSRCLLLSEVDIDYACIWYFLLLLQTLSLKQISLEWNLVPFWLKHMKMEQHIQLHMLVELYNNMKEICS